MHKIKALLNPKMNGDSKFRPSELTRFKSIFDYELILKCNSPTELDILCEDIFTEREKLEIRDKANCQGIGLWFEGSYLVSDEKLTMLVLTYA